MSVSVQSWFSTAPVAVSDPTVTLLDFVDTHVYHSLLFAVRNRGTSPVEMLVETAEWEDITEPDPDNPESLVVSPGSQRTLEIGPFQSRGYWRLRARANPSSLVDWLVRAVS